MFCDSKWRGKTVLITGGSMGLGKQLTLKLCERGAIVIVWGLRKRLMKSLAEQCLHNGFHIHWQQVDVSNREMVYRSALQVLQLYGSLDILINNAGIVIGKPFLQIEDEEIQRTIDVNLMSHFWTVKAFLPEMFRRNQGHIVEISSVAGLVGMNHISEYCASKFGVFGFAESIRRECLFQKSSVNITIICPWLMNTNMFSGVRSPLFRSLDTENVSIRIIEAIERCESRVILPPLLHLLPIIELLPTNVVDWFATFYGALTAMETFSGHGSAWVMKKLRTIGTSNIL